MKRGEGPPSGGGVPPHGGFDRRFPTVGTMASGHYYGAASPTAAFPAVQRASLIPQQQGLLHRQQIRGLQQQQQPLPSLEGEKNVITLYSSVITATIQRCAQLQNAKVLDAIERHWRMALQRRTTELRRSSSSSIPTSGSRGETQQKRGASSSNTGGSSRSSSSNGAAVGPGALQKQKCERSGMTGREAVTSNRDSQTRSPAADAAEQKEKLCLGAKIKTETDPAAATEVSSLEKTFDSRVKLEQSSPGGESQETTGEAAGGDALLSSAAITATGNGMQEVKEEEEDDDEFADADVDEAKPAAEPTESVLATRQEAAPVGAIGAADGARAKAGDTLKAGTAASRDARVKQEDSARTIPEHAEAKPSGTGLTSHGSVEPLDFEQPENLDEVSDIDDQEPPTTDGIFALYEKVQRCGSSGRKATNWKVTLRHGIIRVAHQEIAFDRLHAELRF